MMDNDIKWVSIAVIGIAFALTVMWCVNAFAPKSDMVRCIERTGLPSMQWVDGNCIPIK